MKTVYDYLISQPDLMSYLPGGFYYGGDTPYISRQYAPDAFDSNNRLMNCSFFQPNLSLLIGSPHRASTEDNFSIFTYSAISSISIDPVKRKLFNLLHDARIVPEYGYAWYTEFVMEQDTWWDDHLNAWSHISRYRWIRNKK